jgi:hypothetical protein
MEVHRLLILRDAAKGPHPQDEVKKEKRAVTARSLAAWQAAV